MDSYVAGKKRLRDAFLSRMDRSGNYTTPINGVMMYRRDTATVPGNCFHVPRIIHIVQGRKQTVVGGRKYCYGEDDLLIAGVDVPCTSNILDASPGHPCLSITVELDKSIVTQLAMDMPGIRSNEDIPDPSLIVQPLDPELLDVYLRLEALFDREEHIAGLAPLLIKELHYRVLAGPGGDKIRLFYTYGSQKHQIARAITWLGSNFRERLTVEKMAETIHMAPSTFFRHFKETTGVSPLQFQKRLRLHEAQRLMLVENLDATGAAQAVGYESVTQFNREYKRLFGEPPRRDIVRWQIERTKEPALMPGE